VSDDGKLRHPDAQTVEHGASKSHWFDSMGM